MFFEVTIGHTWFHFLNFCSTLLTSFWLYMIVAKSPPEMKQYKWALFKLALFDELFAVFFGVFLFPDLCFPATGGAVLGLFGVFGQWGGKIALAGTLVFGLNVFMSINDCLHVRSMILHGKLVGTLVFGLNVFMSINDCLHVRSMILHGKARLLEFIFDTWWYGIMLVLGGNICVCAVLFTSMHFALEDNDVFIARTKAEGLYSYIEPYHRRGIPFVSMNIASTEGRILILLICGGVAASYIANLISALILLKKLKSMKDGMSEKTFKAHRMMIHMLLAQNMYPAFSIMLPVVTAIVGFVAPLHVLIVNDWFEPLAGSLVMAHPLISFCCCIAFLKPYRTYMYSFLPERFRKTSTSSSSETTFSSTQANLRGRPNVGQQK